MGGERWPHSLPVSLCSSMSTRCPPLLCRPPPSHPQPARTSLWSAEFPAVPFAPGAISAVALDGQGHAVVNTTLQTCGTPVGLALHAERSLMPADRSELTYVVATVVDGAGRRVPHADHLVSFSLVGPTPAEIAAVGSGNPADAESFRGGARRAFQGRCVAVLRPGTLRNQPRPGRLRLRATADGLRSAEMVMRVAQVVHAELRYGRRVT